VPDARRPASLSREPPGQPIQRRRLAARNGHSGGLTRGPLNTFNHQGEDHAVVVRHVRVQGCGYAIGGLGSALRVSAQDGADRAVHLHKEARSWRKSREIVIAGWWWMRVRQCAPGCGFKIGRPRELPQRFLGCGFAAATLLRVPSQRRPPTMRPGTGRSGAPTSIIHLERHRLSIQG
jgi:hypothetical protein